MKDKANKGYWQRLAKIYAPLMESDKKFYNAICGYIRDYLNWFIKRTGNASAIMYFGINDSKEFANKCSMELLEEKTFFPEALKMLGKKLSFVTKVSMKVAEKKKQVIILRLKLN